MGPGPRSEKGAMGRLARVTARLFGMRLLSLSDYCREVGRLAQAYLDAVERVDDDLQRECLGLLEVFKGFKGIAPDTPGSYHLKELNYRLTVLVWKELKACEAVRDFVPSDDGSRISRARRAADDAGEQLLESFDKVSPALVYMDLRDAVRTFAEFSASPFLTRAKRELTRRRRAAG